jgi:uncharacterized membrane protein YphA (DoxX/SURF4 family)
MVPDGLNSQLTPATLAFIRTAYGLLLLWHLLLTLPHGRRFFLGERWGGYGQKCWQVHLLQNPYVYPVVMAVWLLCAGCLAAGYLSLAASAVNLALCRYYHLRMRWRGVLRGMGAPGFILGWLAAAVFLQEFTAACAPGLQPLGVLVLQVDFALIMFTAGWSKFTSGYSRNEGMEYGMANPEWGYWWRVCRKVSPRHWFFTFNNHMAWGGEVVAAVLMLIPATRFWGGLFILLSFVYIALNIRLLALAPMVMVCCVFFFTAGSPGDAFLAQFSSWFPTPAAATLLLPAWAETVVGVLLWVYLITLPLAYGGMFYNFYCREALPGFLQVPLHAFMNLFGLSLWRVFTADITNFFIRIYRQQRNGEDRTLVSRWGLGGGLRYSHVAEAITVTSLFTTLKYYPGRWEFFKQKLLCYAATVPCRADEVIVFEYVSIRKAETAFIFVPVSEYTVDVMAGSVEEHALDADFSVRQVLPTSPVHETAGMGTYAPARR